ncbi:hypothetical protein BN1723_020053, partial [Verticillium longisporum]
WKQRRPRSRGTDWRGRRPLEESPFHRRGPQGQGPEARPLEHVPPQGPLQGVARLHQPRVRPHG